MSDKIFSNNLVAIIKVKVTFTLNKPAHAGVCILDLRKKVNVRIPLWLH